MAEFVRAGGVVVNDGSVYISARISKFVNGRIAPCYKSLGMKNRHELIEAAIEKYLCEAGF